MNKKYDLCIISNRSALKDKGASLKVYFHYINYFLEKGFKVLYVCFDDLANKKIVINSFNSKNLDVKIFKYKTSIVPNRLSIIQNLNYQKKIEELLKKKKIKNLIAFDIVAAVQVSKIKSIKKYVWLGDLMYETNFYNYLYDLMDDWKKLRSIFFIIYQNYLLRNIYKNCLKCFTKIIVSSKSSESKLLKLGLKSKFLPYPWDEEGGVINLSKKLNILFFGNLYGLGSKSSLRILGNEIYPLLIKKFGKGNFSIKIAGNKSPLLSHSVFKNKEFEILGFVKNLKNILSKSTCLIFPGVVPVGNRCRIITAMSSKCLIIAHNSTQMGNPFLINMKTALLGKNSVELVSKIEFAVNNPSTCKKIRQESFETFKKYYSIEPAGNSFLKEIKLNLDF